MVAMMKATANSFFRDYLLLPKGTYIPKLGDELIGSPNYVKLNRDVVAVPKASGPYSYLVMAYLEEKPVLVAVKFPGREAFTASLASAAAPVIRLPEQPYIEFGCVFVRNGVICGNAYVEGPEIAKISLATIRAYTARTLLEHLFSVQTHRSSVVTVDALDVIRRASSSASPQDLAHLINVLWEAPKHVRIDDTGKITVYGASLSDFMKAVIENLKFEGTTILERILKTIEVKALKYLKEKYGKEFEEGILTPRRYHYVVGAIEAIITGGVTRVEDYLTAIATRAIFGGEVTEVADGSATVSLRKWDEATEILADYLECRPIEEAKLKCMFHPILKVYDVLAKYGLPFDYIKWAAQLETALVKVLYDFKSYEGPDGTLVTKVNILEQLSLFNELLIRTRDATQKMKKATPPLELLGLVNIGYRVVDTILAATQFYRKITNEDLRIVRVRDDAPRYAVYIGDAVATIDYSLSSDTRDVAYVVIPEKDIEDVFREGRLFERDNILKAVLAYEQMKAVPDKMRVEEIDRGVVTVIPISKTLKIIKRDVPSRDIQKYRFFFNTEDATKYAYSFYRLPSEIKPTYIVIKTKNGDNDTFIKVSNRILDIIIAAQKGVPLDNYVNDTELAELLKHVTEIRVMTKPLQILEATAPKTVPSKEITPEILVEYAELLKTLRIIETPVILRGNKATIRFPPNDAHILLHRHWFTLLKTAKEHGCNINASGVTCNVGELKKIIAEIKKKAASQDTVNGVLLEYLPQELSDLKVPYLKLLKTIAEQVLANKRHIKLDESLIKELLENGTYFLGTHHLQFKVWAEDEEKKEKFLNALKGVEGLLRLLHFYIDEVG